MQLPHTIALLLLLMLIGHFGYFYPELPNTLATHFDGRGAPNGWMSKEGYLYFQLFIIGLIGFMMFVLPRLLKHLPHTLVNIPNKKYWLSEERREGTFEIMFREMGWISVGMLLLFIAVNHLVYLANLVIPPRLSDMIWFVFIGFLVFILIWIIRFIVIFKIPDNDKIL